MQVCVRFSSSSLAPRVGGSRASAQHMRPHRAATAHASLVLLSLVEHATAPSSVGFQRDHKRTYMYTAWPQPSSMPVLSLGWDPGRPLASECPRSIDGGRFQDRRQALERIGARQGCHGSTTLWRALLFTQLFERSPTCLAVLMVASRSAAAPTAVWSHPVRRLLREREC